LKGSKGSKKRSAEAEDFDVEVESDEQVEGSKKIKKSKAF
jgi:hypothetical protein